MDPGVLILGVFVGGVVGGLMGAGKAKIGGFGGFFLGAILGPIGWIVIATSKDPPGPTKLEQVKRRPEDLSPGWHDDPLGRFDARWWDGNRWTQDVGRVGADGSRSQFEDPI